ncbi:MAG: hypothetical protein AAB736_02270 [Patescibacteria group bacterium]
MNILNLSSLNLRRPISDGNSEKEGETMSRTFVEANVFKFTHGKDVFLKEKIHFENGDIVKIVIFHCKGKGREKFCTVAVCEVSMERKNEKGEVEKTYFKDVDRSKEVTLVKDFVYENVGSLFELVATV